MPKLPVVKDRELIKILLKLDFIQHKETGSSHLVFSHFDGRRTTVPRHSGKDIPRGTLRAILRDINISPEQFIQVLKS
ncbi:MAG: type II toxin-antitoxin system HicA family toxin [Patescibacteria group bacterium]